MGDANDLASGNDGRSASAPESLQVLSSALRSAPSVETIADALVLHGQSTLGACGVVLALLSDDGSEFFCPRFGGYPQDVAATWRRFPFDSPVPAAVAVRENRPILLETLEKRHAFYPPGFPPPISIGRAIAALPFRSGEAAGAVVFVFPEDREFGAEDRRSFEGAASLGADALARVRRHGLGCEVLVVEDEPQVLRLLDFVLRSHAFTVHRASGGEEAVQIYRQHHGTVSAALLDVQMPGMDGPQTLTHLRGINPGLRCVFMSGNTGQYSGEQLLALGASHVLAKPFSGLDQVVQALRSAARP